MAFYLGGSQNPIGAIFQSPSSTGGPPPLSSPQQSGGAPPRDNPQPQPIFHPMTDGGTPPQAPTNIMGPQALRPTGPSQGFDPAYLQNLVTTIGGLFSRPQGNLSFNPLGDLSQSTQTTGFGNAPVPGLPNTMLQDALNGLGFAFQPQAPSVAPSAPNVGDFGNGNGSGRLLNRR